MSDKQYFMRTLAYVKPYKFSFALGILFYCIQTFAMSAMNSIFLGLIGDALIRGSIQGIQHALIAMAIMLITFAMLIGLGTYTYIVAVAKSVRDMAMDVFKAFVKLAPESQKHSGDGIALINTDMMTASDIFSDALSTVLRNAMGAVFSLAMVFFINWRMGLGVLSIGVVAVFVQSRFAPALSRLGKERLETNADSVKEMSNIMSGNMTIKAYNRQDRALFQFDKQNGKLKKVAFAQAVLGMWQDLFTTVQGWLTTVVVFALGGWLVTQNTMDFAQIMMVFPLAGAVTSSMSQIGTSYASLFPPIVAAKRMFETIDDAGVVCFETSKHDHIAAEKYDLIINNLSFKYHNAADASLHDVSLTIKENTMMAFVGESGSGKSTLLKAVTGLYERDFDMHINGLVYDAKHIRDWRNNFAIVDQSCRLFDLTIGENIALGLGGDASEAQIISAAKLAHIHDFISTLPEGYDTPAGESGSSLSGGQKQRIAIARALISNAPVLVFDEATSALDKESERGIMETINELRKYKTILMTTHHLHYIQNADAIVVMDKGRISQIGTHDALMSHSEIYARLITHEQRNE